MLIGVGEAVISGLVVAAVARTRPELLAPREEGAKSFALPALVLSLAVAAFVAPFASPWPDGLERAAELLGFDARARVAHAPITDYRWPGFDSPLLATAIAGVVGTAAMFALGLALARWLVPRRERVRARSSSPVE